MSHTRARARVRLSELSVGVNETGTNDIPDVAFRYSDGIWIFNMATSNMQAPATYTFRINLATGFIQFQFGTK
jgi:hypothetical protein